MASSLDPAAHRRLNEIADADLLVGIPCFQNEATIGGVIDAVDTGLRRHFPDLRGVICASDGGSTDATRDVAARTDGSLDRAVFEYRGTAGKGSAVRAILEAADRLGVRVCALVDADLRSITPLWVDRLIGPVVRDGFDYVAPLYVRHKHDATITNAVAYPLTTALYGVRIRQPIGGEFGLSGELARRLAEQDVWETDVARFGIDIWMTTSAVVGRYRVCQAVLGAKVHDPKDPGADLGPMFRQVVGSLFSLAGRHRDRWAEVGRTEVPPTFGERTENEAEPVAVSVARLETGFRERSRRDDDLWRRTLSPEALAEVERAATSSVGLDDDAWFTILYDYLVAYHRGDTDAGELLDSLIPLYYARTAGFVDRTADATDDEADAMVEKAVDSAVARKPYLVGLWSATFG